MMPQPESPACRCHRSDMVRIRFSRQNARGPVAVHDAGIDATDHGIRDDIGGRRRLHRIAKGIVSRHQRSQIGREVGKHTETVRRVGRKGRRIGNLTGARRNRHGGHEGLFLERRHQVPPVPSARSSVWNGSEPTLLLLALQLATHARAQVISAAFTAACPAGDCAALATVTCRVDSATLQVVSCVKLPDLVCWPIGRLLTHCNHTRAVLAPRHLECPLGQECRRAGLCALCLKHETFVSGESGTASGLNAVEFNQGKAHGYPFGLVKPAATNCCGFSKKRRKASSIFSTSVRVSTAASSMRSSMPLASPELAAPVTKSEYFSPSTPRERLTKWLAMLTVPERSRPQVQPARPSRSTPWSA